MMRYLFFTTLILVFIGCAASTFKKERSAFENAKITQQFKSVADMNDAYFDVKENNFFEFYKLLYDSVKNTSYPGKYTTIGDTMLLTFYNKKGYQLLGHKALINKQKKEIIFFDKVPGSRKKVLIN